MKFKRIKIKNLRSYTEQEIIFPEGSLLLAGDVGAGKTSILLAIEYALFGLQPGQKGASLLRNNEQNGEVSLELEASGKSILIERRLKRTERGVSNEYAAITINGHKEESSLTEIKLKVVNLLGYPEEFVKRNNLLYKYTVYTPQEQMKQIITEDPETRLNMLRHIFGIDKYKQIKSNLSILTSTLKSNSKLLQGEILSLEHEKENLKNRHENLKLLSEKIRLKSLELEERIKVRKLLELKVLDLMRQLETKREYEKEIEKTQILFGTKQDTLSSVSKELGELMDFLKEIQPFDEREYLRLIQEIQTTKACLENLNSQHLEIKSQINSLEKEMLDIRAKKERIFRIQICPTCLQDVPENHKHNILNETESKLSGITKELSILKESSISLIRQIEEVKKRASISEENKMKMEILKSKTQQIEKSRIKVKELEKQKQVIGEDRKMLLKHIESLKEKVFSHLTFETQFKKQESELNKSIAEEKTSEISLAELRRESEISKREISLAEESVAKKEISKEKMRKLNELIDWLSTKFFNLVEITERQVLMKLRNEFSALFAKWFHMLVAESSLDSRIDENFTPLILQGDVEMDYSFLSGGERTALALAYRLALNQTINSLLSKIKTKGLIILDEPTDGFSEAQIDRVRDILDELNAEQLIIVSHEQKIEGFVDNVIKIEKQGDISTIKQTLTANTLNG